MRLPGQMPALAPPFPHPSSSRAQILPSALRPFPSPSPNRLFSQFASLPPSNTSPHRALTGRQLLGDPSSPWQQR